jgi:hypothetical protein
MIPCKTEVFIEKTSNESIAGSLLSAIVLRKEYEGGRKSKICFKNLKKTQFSGLRPSKPAGSVSNSRLPTLSTKKPAFANQRFASAGEGGA